MTVPPEPQDKVYVARVRREVMEATRRAWACLDLTPEQLRELRSVHRARSARRARALQPCAGCGCDRAMYTDGCRACYYRRYEREHPRRRGVAA